MGCDIHIYPEVFKNNKQTFADKIKDDDRDPGLYYEFEYDFRKRNYALFSILANVRNGHENGGVGGNFNTINGKRGIPTNASVEINELIEEDGMAENGGDGHSHSWNTLRELLTFNWEQIVKLKARVTAWEEREMTYRDAVGKQYLDKMFEALGSFGNPDNVRIVFWFDN